MTRKCESPNHEGMPASRRARPLHTPLPPLPLPRLPCTSSNRDTRVQPEITPGWTQGGEAPSGAAPPPTTPNLPPQPEHTLLAGQSSRRSGGGRGDCHAAPGLANGSGTSLFQPRAVGPPMHIGAGRRSFRRTPSNAAIFTVLGRAPQAASFSGSRSSGCVTW